jgi:hypothetical protein
MHEVVDFAKGIFKGLGQAIKSDVDVFLITFAGLLWPFKILKGLSIGTFLYVIIRRVDGLMTGFLAFKSSRDQDA